jgi:hypothetical protein
MYAWTRTGAPAQPSPREAALAEIAHDFIAKVDRGEARSQVSYAAFKAALALSSAAPRAVGCTAWDISREVLGPCTQAELDEWEKTKNTKTGRILLMWMDRALKAEAALTSTSRALPPDWEQDKAETSRMKPAVTRPSRDTGSAQSLRNSEAK